MAFGLGKKHSPDDDIKKLSRSELLEMLIEQTRLADRLRARNKKLARELAVCKANLEKAASLRIIIARLERIERLSAAHAGLTEEEIARLMAIGKPKPKAAPESTATENTREEPEEAEEKAKAQADAADAADAAPEEQDEPAAEASVPEPAEEIGESGEEPAEETGEETETEPAEEIEETEEEPAEETGEETETEPAEEIEESEEEPTEEPEEE